MPMSLDAAAEVFRDAMRETVRRYSLWYLIEGVLLMAAGVLAIIYPVISSTAVSRNPKDSPARRNTSRSSRIAVSDAISAPLSVERSELFRVCFRLLAIATLNGFGERCNLFDGRCEILCTCRLLPGSNCRLG